MQINSFMLLARMYVGDFAKSAYSDFQILGALNFVLWLLAQISAQKNNVLLRKTTPALAVVDGEFVLPEDFFSLVRAYGENGEELLAISEKGPPASGEVLVQGRRGFSGEGSVVLVYNSFLPTVFETTESLSIPAAWEVPLARATGFYVTGGLQEARGMLDLFLNEGGI